MTPAETIQAAIEKLAALKSRPDIERQFTVNVDQETAEWWLRITERVERDKRTIAAQLLVMRNELEDIAIEKEEAGQERPVHHDVFTLARAILGEQVDR